MSKLFITSTIVLLAMKLVLGQDKSQVPGLHGPGCTIIDNIAYAFGGAKKEGEQDLNTKVYKMDLTNLDKLFWESTEYELPQGVIYPSVIKKNKDSKTAIVIGGKRTPVNSAMLTLDVSQQAASVSKSAVKLNLTDVTSKSSLQFFPYGGGMDQSDINPEEFILYSSITLNNEGTNQNFNSLTMKYNINTNNWTNLDPSLSPKPFYQSTFHIYKGVMYGIGGSDLPDSTIRELNKVWSYDLRQNSWKEENLKGSDVGTRNVHSSALVENMLYVVGGANGNLVNDKIAILDMNTKLWSEKTVKGLDAKNQGCLLAYQNKLIYTFGFSPQMNSTVQVIDLKTFTVQVPAKPVPLGTILGAAIGGGLGLIILVVAGWFFYRRHKRIKAQHEEYLKQYDENIKAHKEYLEATSAPKDLDVDLESNNNALKNNEFEESNIDSGLGGTGSGTGTGTGVESYFNSTLTNHHSSNIQQDFKI